MNILKACYVMLFVLTIFTVKETFAEQFFEKKNTWDTPIPSNAVIAPQSTNYIKDILSNSNTIQLTYRDWSFPIWRAEASTPVVSVQMANPEGNCGSSALANGWNKIPIPSEAKAAGMDAWCSGSTDGGKSSTKNRDMHLVVLSHDGKWEWDLYKARNCGAGWIANCLRKRARTVAASTEGKGMWDGSGVGPVFQPVPNVFSQDDLLGNPRACGQSAHTQGLITYNDYKNGYINHAIMFAYFGEKKLPEHYGHYPCLSYRQGLVDRDNAMYLGRRLQLNPSYDCTQHQNNFTKMVCEALKKYGAIFAINTGAGYNQLYLESIEGKTDFWTNIIQNPLPIPISEFRVVEPVCSDCAVCQNCVTPTPAPPPPPPAPPAPVPPPGSPQLLP